MTNPQSTQIGGETHPFVHSRRQTTEISNGFIGTGREFPEESQSILESVSNPFGSRASRSLGNVVRLYWGPVYNTIRNSWSRSSDDAKDLTQEFFATIVFERRLLSAFDPQRGSFRALLRTALKRFLLETHKSNSRFKRGGGTQRVPLDSLEGEIEPYPNAHRISPDALFASNWRQVVIRAAIARLEEAMVESGRAMAYEIFRQHDLESDVHPVTYAQLGVAHGLTTAQIKHILIDVRSNLRIALTEIVSEYVSNSDELESELRFLLDS